MNDPASPQITARRAAAAAAYDITPGVQRRLLRCADLGQPFRAAPDPLAQSAPERVMPVPRSGYDRRRCVGILVPRRLQKRRIVIP